MGVSIDSSSAFSCDCGGFGALGKVLVASFNVRFHLSVEPIAVDGYASPSMRVWAARDRTAVYEVCVGRDIIVPAISTVLRD